jgi:hypothetical protein
MYVLWSVDDLYAEIHFFNLYVKPKFIWTEENKYVLMYLYAHACLWEVFMYLFKQYFYMLKIANNLAAWNLYVMLTPSI